VTYPLVPPLQASSTSNLEGGILTHVTKTGGAGPGLFDDSDVTRDDRGSAADLRARALGGVLALFRAQQGWAVETAAAHARLSHMTWRRLEEGRAVRTKSLAAVDRLLERPIGTVSRALRDDLLMLQLVNLVTDTGEAAHGVVPFLQRFAEQSGPGRVTTARGPSAWPVVAEHTSRALAIAAQHVATVQPTELELATRLIERLVSAAGTTPAIRVMVQSVAAAIPDLMARALDQVEHDMAGDRAPVDAVEHDVARLVAGAQDLAGCR
jgi:hypothetical protein